MKMRRRLFTTFAAQSFASLIASLIIQTAIAAPSAGPIQFGVVSHAVHEGSSEQGVTSAIAAANQSHLAFAVINGLKTPSEPCSDKIYLQRRNRMRTAKRDLIVSLAASDWTGCRYSNGRSSAVERLNRLRELFFSEDVSQGAGRIAMIRQSASARFRTYDENARWSVGTVLFATVNLPANNNNFRLDAGRNSEFDDRSIANRDWMQRIFILARQRKMQAIVLFSDADPLHVPTGVRRDGFAEIRRQIKALAAQFDGKVLLIHGQQTTPRTGKPIDGAAIEWEGNLGRLAAPPQLLEININPDNPQLFSVGEEPESSS